MIREPVVAGKFYPASPEALRTMIAKMIDEQASRQDAIGLVLPHAGYPYSGPVAGSVLSQVNPADTYIIIGPNHTGKGKPFSIMTEGKWRTPLGEAEIHSELAQKILSASPYLQEDAVAHESEHSIEVQLPFLQCLHHDFKFVPISLSYGVADVLKQIGKAIAAAIKETGSKAIIIASSDMTHYESQKSVRSKDSLAINSIIKLDEDGLLQRISQYDITMCGFAPTVSMLTAARELGANGAELVRYQTSGDVTGDYSAVVGYAGIIVKQMSPQVILARSTVERYIREGKTSQPEQMIPEMQARAGVFVSIHKLGQLRGCIGTFEPTRKNIAEEIMANAVSSATRDPRFSPISPDELDQLSYSVDVLTPPEKVSDQIQLDPKKYGVIVECGYRRGLLLPDLEGVDTVDYQIDICRQKACIGLNEPVQLYRFQVKRYR